MSRGKGQSKGCRTCRRRKLKCDERHPACLRCEKGNILCGGYDRDLRFVDEVARTVRHARKGASSANTNTSAPVTYPRKSSLGPSKTSNPPLELNLSAFENNIVISFLLAKLLAGVEPSKPWLHNPWLYLLVKDTSSVTAQNGTLALGRAYFGRMNRQESIVNRALEPYGQALRSLNNDLRDPSKACSVSALTNAMALEIFEFVSFSSKSGWLQHAGGVGRLIELRGPLRHQTTFERELLQGNRVTIALDCLIKKRRCFLERPEWKILPWALEPQLKTPIHNLHDILCDIPGIFEDATTLENGDLHLSHRENLRIDVSSNILSRITLLYEWRWKWEADNPAACYEVDSVLSYSAAQDTSPILTSLYFSTLLKASEITFYNAILLLLFNLGHQVIGPTCHFAPQPIHHPKISTSPLLLPDQALTPQSIATEICKCLEYHLQEPHSSAGAFFLLFPIRVAYQAFDPRSKEAVWLARVMATIADLSGLEISRNLNQKGSMPVEG